MVNFLRPRRGRPAEPLWLLAGAAHSRPCSSNSAENPGFDHGGGDAMRPPLNALFAISVNSPSMSMVNFPCCVFPRVEVRRAWRKAKSNPPQPTCVAVVMEAGVDAYL